jgi:hypothetical protein
VSDGCGGTGPRRLYCHCAFAQVVPQATKHEVLRRLGESGAAFDAVPDLCEMAARKDPALKRLAADGELRIAACFPRAVRWLFHAGGAPLTEGSYSVLNMRDQEPDEVLEGLLGAATTEVVS